MTTTLESLYAELQEKEAKSRAAGKFGHFRAHLIKMFKFAETIKMPFTHEQARIYNLCDLHKCRYWKSTKSAK